MDCDAHLMVLVLNFGSLQAFAVPCAGRGKVMEPSSGAGGSHGSGPGVAREASISVPRTTLKECDRHSCATPLLSGHTYFPEVVHQSKVYPGGHSSFVRMGHHHPLHFAPSNNPQRTH
ncbi:hypothetical protein B0T26DRAFT_121385 [Lasiosphaeria miniovina]|uniref:Secreted protein n=1 Tax=Lasiosphaeria miniovina TaxID=1954250 RepID=A0AA40B3V1_9PEZI|nr:uncharacterized protein B0T26DRAFT_121385 [Lasiosphaeria miniovina]KAK0727184.1 hypothetical protein B0T26DRAFT_121385 [Lasiosphaeria miniovina]